MYTSENIFELNYKNKSIKLLSVRHDRRNIDVDILKNLLDQSNKQKTCFLFETDFRKNKIEIRKNFGDHTTKQFMNLLLKEEKDKGIKKCIRGWDIRQSILTQKYQDFLYQMYYKIPFITIENFYFNKLNIRKVENKNLDQNIKLFLNHNYNQSINHFKNMIFRNINIIKKIIQPTDYNLQIFQIFQKYNNTKNVFDDLSKLLFYSYATISDLYLLENILSNNNDTNYIVIMGEFHFNDTINFIKYMQKDNIL